MISKLKKTNEIIAYDDIVFGNSIKHIGDLCFSVFLYQGIYRIKQEISNYAYTNDCYMAVCDMEGNNIAYSYGIGNPFIQVGIEPLNENEYGVSLQISKSGIYVIHSNFHKIAGDVTKTITITKEESSSSSESPGDVIPFSENNVENYHKFNSFDLQGIYGKINDYSINEWDEIPLKNDEKIFVSSNDTTDNNFPINNMIDGENSTYTLFSAIRNTKYIGMEDDEISEKESVSILFSFPKQENVCYVMIDHIADMDLSRFRWYLVLSGSNDKKTWTKINTVYPGFKQKIREGCNAERDSMEAHSLYIVDDLNKQFDMSPIKTIVEETETIENEGIEEQTKKVEKWVIEDSEIIHVPHNPKYLINFHNDNSYKYYRLDFKAMRTDYEEQSVISHSFKIIHLKCFSKKSNNSPVARFPLITNTRDVNDWVNYDATSISFLEIKGKQCAMFASDFNSDIMLPKFFLANEFEGLTISLFFYVPSDVLNDYDKHVLVSKHFWDIGFFQEQETQNVSLFSNLVLDGENYDVQLKNSHEILMEDFCDRWHHVCFTFGNGIFSLYLDSELVGKFFCNRKMKYVINNIDFYNIYVGCEMQEGDAGSSFLIHRFNGYMRELTFYKKALLKHQIRQIYLKGI